MYIDIFDEIFDVYKNKNDHNIKILDYEEYKITKLNMEFNNNNDNKNNDFLS